MHSEVVNIPKDRIAALIGSKASNKKQVETRGKCKLRISSSGTVTIQTSDVENLLSVKQVVEAIGRGFNPEAAVLLFRDEYALEILEMNAYTKSKARLATLRARVIGLKGAARRKLEQITGTAICIYGKTIGIIGKSEDAYLAQRAMEMILEGSNHVSVFRWVGDQLQ